MARHREQGRRRLVAEAEVVCSDPEEHRRRAEERVLDIAGLTKPTWEHIDEVTVESYGDAIYDAGDALAQDLADILGPLTGSAGGEPFVEEVMDATAAGWYDSLVLLRTIGIHELFRGQGIGAWAAARGIVQLAPSDTTLVALKASPLSRTKFLKRIGVADPESHRDLTPAETIAWDAACARIGANWQQGLGLVALTDHPGVLYAPGGMNDALAATLRRP